MQHEITAVEAFYRASLAGLRALEAAGGRARYFGEEADARWKAFQGELREADRLDLLLRDAAVSHPAAFAPRVVFPIPGLADDEPFGPDWPSLSGPRAVALWREPPPKSPTLEPVLAAVAEIWSLRPEPPAAGALDSIGPATRILAAGAGAILGLARHFEGRRDLDLASQVLLISDLPGERQLFGLAAALLGSAGKVQLAPTSVDLAALQAAGLRGNALLAADPGSRGGEVAAALLESLRA